jgi:O-methyltransferase
MKYVATEPDWVKLPFDYQFVEDGKQKSHHVRSYRHFYERDRKFRELYAQVHGVTRMPPERAWGLYQLAGAAHAICGDVAEVGVFRGGTAKFLTLLLSNISRSFYFYDTWDGIPVVDERHDNPVLLGQFANVNLGDVMEFVGNKPNHIFTKGVFPFEGFCARPFAFVHIDVDTHVTVKNSLEKIYHHVVPGGVIVIDDYDLIYEGVKPAVDSFFQDKKETPINMIVGQAFIIKR